MTSGPLLSRLMTFQDPMQRWHQARELVHAILKLRSETRNANRNAHLREQPLPSQGWSSLTPPQAKSKVRSEMEHNIQAP